MKETLLAAFLLTALSGCGASVAPLAAPAAPSMAAAGLASAQSTTSARLVVASAQDIADVASSVEGHDARGSFDLRLVWTAVPRTYISALTWVSLDGASLETQDAGSVQRELDQAAADPANARYARALTDIAQELDEYQPARG